MFDIRNTDRRLLAAAVLILAVIFFTGVKYGEIRSEKDQAKNRDTEELSIKQEKTTAGPSEFIQVYITGEVAQPRVLKLKSGARVFEAVEQVELLPDAEIKNINMARPLQDGESVIIPGPDSVQGIAADTGLTSTTGGIVGGLTNINTASAAEMDDKLPGIGPALAQRIVDYRTANGAFVNIEDIKNVSGIGDKKFEDLKNLITVR